MTTVSACVPPTQSDYKAYSDPRELIGETGINPTAEYDSLKLGVIYSKNAENAFSYLSTTMQQYAAWGVAAFNPEPLENGIKMILANRFHEATRVTSMDDAFAKNTDLVMILDMKVTAGQMSGKQTTIMINGIFMDMESNVLEKVQAEGQRTIPWPAIPVYDGVVEDALKQFGNKFDQSTQLASKLESLQAGPALPVVATGSRRVLGSSDFSNRTALVIGNSNYRTGALRNPVNDAQDISRRLKDAGFKVVLLRNAKQRAIEDGVHRLGMALRQGGVGIFYYAGHAMQVDGRNYLIPIGANIRTEADIRYEAVDVGRILGTMEGANNNLNIVMLDACRNNPFARSFRSASRGLAIMDAPKGSLIAYSTSPGDVAEDGRGRNGTYTKHLLRHMLTPGVTIEDVLKRVRIDVSEETAGRQVPWESSSLTGYFYLKKSE